MQLRLFARQSPVSVLGPGQRAVIWVQGCRFACKNCIVPESWDESAGEQVTVAQMAAWVLAQPGIEGITLSGGEPMLQAPALSHLIDLVREKADLGVVCYTGYRLEQLQQGTLEQQDLLQRVDLLIDGIYIEQQHADLLWRGSANQRLISLTERYQSLIISQKTQERSVGLQFFMEPTGEIQFVGIPNQPGFRQEFESRMLNRGVILDRHLRKKM
ncbi:4Fe-4S single cluster domain-containing protein [Iningainema tapete]|uniref:Radical SAM protein n=1 Tax=Iningainema tapete BLCC-T55 TaxID=2748662 RepID=A0A8J7CDW0_9CYAN|nr:4Fe-4S single cluster domain-containing protein [Iningainema tapete]MBD2773100.1 radical SAM protein [Iningainema tapete BLCC-T55]